MGMINRKARNSQRGLALAILLAPLLGCGVASQGSDYYWLSKAGKRTYDITITAPFAGTVQGLAIVRDDGEVKVDGRSYRKAITTYQGVAGLPTETTFYRLAADGIFARNSDSPSSDEMLEFPLPPTIGRRWTEQADGIDMVYEIVAIEDLDTEQKSYKRCVKVVGTGKVGRNQVTTEGYFSPEFGLVKRSMRGGGSSFELILRPE